MSIKIQANHRLNAVQGLGNISMKVGDKNVVIKTSNFAEYHDGFSFTVETELEAFQVAYKYRGSRVMVKPTPTQGWLVQVYKK